jgi:phage-related minor tail protein
VDIRAPFPLSLLYRVQTKGSRARLPTASASAAAGAEDEMTTDVETLQVMVTASKAEAARVREAAKKQHLRVEAEAMQAQAKISALTGEVEGLKAQLQQQNDDVRVCGRALPWLRRRVDAAGGSPCWHIRQRCQVRLNRSVARSSPRTKRHPPPLRARHRPLHNPA